MQKWTKVDAFFVYFIFFLLFSLIPPSTCYYVTTPFLQNTPIYQRFCYIFTFFIIFVTLSGIKLVLESPLRPSPTERSRSRSRSRSRFYPHPKSERLPIPTPARTRGHSRPPPISFLFFLISVLTCEKDSSVSEKARIFMTAFERLKKAQDPVIRRSLSRL